MLTNYLHVNSRNHGEACCSHSLHREQSTAHCEVVRFRLARAEELRKKERSHCWKSPSGKQSKSGWKHCCCNALFATEYTSQGKREGGPPTGHHRFSYLCHKPQRDTTHKVTSPCHTNLTTKSKCRSSESVDCVSDSKVDKESFEFPHVFPDGMLYLLIGKKISHS